MTLTPRPYQSTSVAAVLAHWRSGVRRVCVVSPPGSGKTTIGTMVALERRTERGLWLANRIELLDQAADRLRSVGLDVGIISPQHAPDPWARVQVASLDTLVARGKRPPAEWVVKDESHHAPAATYSAVLDSYPDADHLGLTATPCRQDAKALTGHYDVIVVAASYSELLRDGHIVPCRVAPPPESDGYLGNAIAKDPLAAWLEMPEGPRQTIAFAPTVDRAYEWAAAFNAAGIPSACVEGNTSDAERSAMLERFRAGELRVLWNVYCLDSETELLTPRGWVRHDTIHPADQVAQWDAGAVSFVAPSRVFSRPRLPGERMVSLTSKRRSIRVTENHRMLYRTLYGGRWMAAEARELVDRTLQVPVSGVLAAPLSLAVQQEEHRPIAIASNAFALRTRSPHLSIARSRATVVERGEARRALRYKQPRELSASECSLIGFWLGDGSVSRLRRGGVEYTLCQCAEDHGVIDWLDRTLRDCGVHFIKREHYAGSNSIRWSLPRGTGHGPQSRAGVYPIEPYLVKGGSDLFWGLNRIQVDALLHGFWMAEGNHGPDGFGSKNARGFQFVNTNKGLMDLLQALAATHGYHTNLFPAAAGNQSANAAQLWMLTLRYGEDSHRASKRGAVFELEAEWRPETVWCATVPSGYLVTRRRGTVTILGNCLTEGTDIPSASCCLLARGVTAVGPYLQITGRVLRPAPGKMDSRLIDLSGAFWLHGAPTADREYSLDGRPIRMTGEPLKNCPQCGSVVPARLPECECGYVWPARERPRLRVFDLALQWEIEAAGGDPTAVSDAAKRREWERLVGEMLAREWSLGFVRREYEKLFACKPPAAWVAELGDGVEARELAKLEAVATKHGYKAGWVSYRFKAMFGRWPRRRRVA